MLHCYTTVQGMGEGWDPANMFNPATLFNEKRKPKTTSRFNQEFTSKNNL